MAYEPKKDSNLPACNDEVPKVYDVIDNLNVMMSVWSGDGQKAGVKINAQAVLEVDDVFVKDLGVGQALKGSVLKVDAEVARTNPASAEGSLTIVLHQPVTPEVPANVERWCITWQFTAAETKLISESIYVQ